MDKKKAHKSWWKQLRRFMKTNTSLTIIISAVLLLEMMMGVMFYAAQNFIQQTMERMAIALTGGVLWFDVNKGIERLSKILMPLLFVMLIVMGCHGYGRVYGMVCSQDPISRFAHSLIPVSGGPALGCSHCHLHHLPGVDEYLLANH